jgi:hypothetical protein
MRGVFAFMHAKVFLNVGGLKKQDRKKALFLILSGCRNPSDFLAWEKGFYQRIRE